ncbi:SDR family oxidoreductase [Candidatus Aciduliprofundum boonei]|uniref:Short-chain dehydrogenase/reductase SDR n=1 Tax=Aciduliprofundum boonei (strain DSM 19572 / T469) TaxID=439481 RepID=D3TC98_ACIB4|nr:SDR family NAD(P)-dependent oxidoreductase [Candidatus Aciduliprofundum boonei]ADD08183.1 short-chain dehydrogenase/reductase SDR [Aciduliprofundum boonei T469]
MKAIITGGDSGLGFHIAKELKNRRYEIIIIARNEDKLRRAAENLKANWYAIDLSKNYEDAGEIIKRKNPTILVNNAGFGLYGKFEEQNWDKLENMIKLNILALTYLTYIGLKVMNTGHILNVSSVAACRAQKKLSVYAATKSYVEQFTKSLNKERRKIKISYLLPGPTKTDFFKNANMPTRGFERFMLNPEKVAKYAVDKMLKGKERIVPGIIYKLYCL